MVIVNLPDDILPQKDSTADRIVFYDYTAGIETVKGKATLHKNAISLVIAGEKTMHFSERTIYITDDTFHFLSAGNCIASVVLSANKAFRTILVFFDDSVFAEFTAKYHTRVASILSQHHIVPQGYLSFKKDAFVLNYIDSLRVLFSIENEISPEMRLLKFEELMLHLLEQNPAQLLSFQSDAKGELDEVAIRKAVEANIANNISIEELAFLCNMSLSTFKRRFVKMYGTSPRKWML